MHDLSELQDRLRKERPVPWDQLPDFALYMDQVLSYMDRQVIRFDEDDGLTAAMVNNYTKSGLVPRASGKKYGRDHLAYLSAPSPTGTPPSAQAWTRPSPSPPTRSPSARSRTIWRTPPSTLPS